MCGVKECCPRVKHLSYLHRLSLTSFMASFSLVLSDFTRFFIFLELGTQEETEFASSLVSGLERNSIIGSKRFCYVTRESYMKSRETSFPNLDSNNAI